MLRTWLTALSFAFILVGCGSSQGGDSSPAPSVRPSASSAGPPAVPSDGALLGAFVNYEHSHDQDVQRTQVPTFESEIGRHLAIDHHYYAWDEPFPRDWDRWDVGVGRIPMISWTCGNTATIAAGGYDSLIAQRAQDVKAFGAPIFLRWFWEVDLLNSSHDIQCLRGGGSSYVAAWRRIWQIFHENHVTNVAWVWCLDQSAFQGRRDREFYPGDQYVDWICADGYSRERPPVSFTTIFGTFHAEWARSGKPLMIGEMGALSGLGQGRWIREASTAIKERYPAIRAVVYWDGVADASFALENSPGLDAFREMAQDPYFAPTD